MAVQKLFYILLPVWVMIATLFVTTNDYLITAFYALMGLAALINGNDKKEWGLYLLGFVLLSACELFFVSTGVETFNRKALIAGMPIWLPFLWAYAFILMRRALIAWDDLFGRRRVRR